MLFYPFARGPHNPQKSPESSHSPAPARKRPAIGAPGPEAGAGTARAVYTGDMGPRGGHLILFLAVALAPGVRVFVLGVWPI